MNSCGVTNPHSLPRTHGDGCCCWLSTSSKHQCSSSWCHLHCNTKNRHQQQLGKSPFLGPKTWRLRQIYFPKINRLNGRIQPTAYIKAAQISLSSLELYTHPSPMFCLAAIHGFSTTAGQIHNIVCKNMQLCFVWNCSALLFMPLFIHASWYASSNW